MNILTKKLPESITVNGEEYRLNTDFRVWIKVSQIAFNADFNAVTIAEILSLTLQRLPADLNKTVKELMNFYACGNKKNTDSETAETQRRIFDFNADSHYIYAAFLQQYNIDLCNTNLHWWVFRSLFDSISEDTHFGKIMQYRCMDISKIKDKEQKAFYLKMKGHYALPDNRSEEEKEQSFAEVLNSVF